VRPPVSRAGGFGQAGRAFRAELPPLGLLVIRLEVNSVVLADVGARDPVVIKRQDGSEQAAEIAALSAGLPAEPQALDGLLAMLR
jgi:hypothetical protein